MNTKGIFAGWHAHVSAALRPPNPDPAALIVAWAEEQWARIIREPDAHGPVPEITDYILNGACWPTANVQTWAAGAPYQDGGKTGSDSFAWCGAFAAAAVAQLGVSPKLRRQMVSPERLHEHLGSFAVETSDTQPGDVLTVGPPKGKRRFGLHIALAVKTPADGLVETIEGNAVGLLPDGGVGEGVVRRTRPLPGLGGRKVSCPLSGRPQTAEVICVYRVRGPGG